MGMRELKYSHFNWVYYGNEIGDFNRSTGDWKIPGKKFFFFSADEEKI